jgi:flagellar capping protein FliD
MFDAFNSELKNKVEGLVKKYNELQWLFTNRLESIDRKIGELKDSTQSNGPSADIQDHDELKSRIESIEKKLLMGRWAPK